MAAVGVLAACSSVDLTPTDRYDLAYAMKNEANAQLYLNSFYSIGAQWGSFGSCALGGASPTDLPTSSNTELRLPVRETVT